MQVTNDTMRRVLPNGRIAVVAVLIGIAVVPAPTRRAVSCGLASRAGRCRSTNRFHSHGTERADGPRRARHDSS